MSGFRLILFFFPFFPIFSGTGSPVPYSGKVAVDGINFHGSAEFSFTIADANGLIHWSSATEEQKSLEIFVVNGRYFALLGGQGTPPLPPRLFLDHSGLILKVSVDLKDEEGMRPLLPDQPITATPLALAAEYARIAESVAPGSITKDMLSADVLADLNRTQTVPSAEPSTSSFEVTPGSITHELLSPAVLADLNSSISQITREMLPPSVLADLNKSITRSDLPPSVLADLNRTITRDMLPASVLADLNKSITRSDLPSSVLADLNRTITKNNLGSDVLSDLNSSISLNRLSPEVLAALQVTPSISTQPFARYDWRTDSATIEARGRGHNLSYQWLKNGQIIAGANAPVLELSNPVLDYNATYTVQLTNSVGQTTSQNITLQQAIGAPGLPLAEANATQVPRNGLVLWLDANDLNADGLADNLPTGTLIDSWKSKEGDANATQSTELLKPKSNFFGDTNLKAVAFDGGDYLLDDNASLPVQHIFAVYRGNFDRNDIMISNEVNNLIQVYTDHGSRFLYGDFFKEDGGTIRVSGRDCPKYESHNYITWQTDLLNTTAGSGGSYNGNITNLGIGAKTSSANNWEGEFGEILFYNRALSNTERDAVERYLADKWSIQLHADKLAAEQAAYNAALPTPEPETGLLAYYKFEPLVIEPNMVWDHSGNGKHLTMSGFDGDPWVEGVNGKALKFDGVDSKASGVSNQDLVTVCFWVKPQNLIDSLNQSSSIFFNTNGDSSGTVGSFSFNAQLDGQPSHMAVWQRKKKNAPDWKITRTNFSQNHTIFNNWLFILLNFNSLTQVHEIFLNNEKLPTTGSSPLERNTNQGSFSIGYHNLSNVNESESFSGLLDEFRIYNRSLTPAEIEGLYLQVKNPILRMAPEHNATVGSNFSLSLAADNGPTTYLVEGLPAGLSLNTTTGQITGTLSQPGYHRVFVKAMNEHGMGSDTIAIIARPQTDQYGWPVDVPDGSAIPQNGLVLWLDANDIDADGEFDIGTDHLKLANWADKAGHDHNATQANAANQPEIRTGQISGKPNLNVLVFEGNQSLDFERFTQIRTFFWVAGRSTGNLIGGSAIFYDTETKWKSMAYGTSLWEKPHGTSPIITDGQNRLNGSIFSGNGTFPTDLSIISTVTTDFAKAQGLGKLNANNNFFYGRIGEILIYDQALPINQIETVEKYLGQKWGISISHDTTPSPTGNPPTFSVTPANDSVTTAHLSEQILKYLKPEITAQPQATYVFLDSNHTFSVTAEGKYLTYQWKKNGTDLLGETNATLTINDANATLHDGNYSVLVSNDFGSVESIAKPLTVLDSEMNGLIGWWPLDGNTSDASGNNNHAISSGAINSIDRNGDMNKSYYFDGVDDFISLGQVAGGLQDFTFSLLIKSNQVQSADYDHGNPAIIGIRQSSGQTEDYNLAIKEGILVWYDEMGEVDFKSSGKFISDNNWHLVSFSRIGNLHSFAVNGNLISQFTGSNLALKNEELELGRSLWSNAMYFKGHIDEVRIYNRGLSSTEVKALYNQIK